MDSRWRLCAVSAGLLAVAGCTEQAPRLLTWSPAPAQQRAVANANAPAAKAPYLVPTTGTSRLPPARRQAEWRRNGSVAKPASAPLPVPAGPTGGNPASVVVQRGETLYDISQRYHVPLRLLLDANRLRPPYRILAGQRLVLPKPVTHFVRPGETLYGLSRLYRVGLYELVSANNIRPPYRLDTGTVLVIPPPEGGPPAPPLNAPLQPRTVVAGRAAPPPPRMPPRPAASPGLPPARGQAETRQIAHAAPRAQVGHPEINDRRAEHGRPERHLAAKRSTATPPAPRREPAQGAMRGPVRPFLWPVRGRVLVGFGPESDGLSNDGINIAVREGTPVRAAAGGTVVYAGNELRGYGNLLLIRHRDGWITAYAHNAKLLVRRGERVKRGEIIARAGETGGVRSPQLHFEIRHGARPVNPLHYLTALREPRGSRSG